MQQLQHLCPIDESDAFIELCQIDFKVYIKPAYVSFCTPQQKVWFYFRSYTDKFDSRMSL